MVTLQPLFVNWKVCEIVGQCPKMTADLMAKNDRIGVRVSGDLKKLLIEIADREDRSLAQVCEIFLRDGARSYKEEGPRFFQRLLSRPKKNSGR
jgi:hypothetical protein